MGAAPAADTAGFQAICAEVLDAFLGPEGVETENGVRVPWVRNNPDQRESGAFVLTSAVQLPRTAC